MRIRVGLLAGIMAGCFVLVGCGSGGSGDAPAAPAPTPSPSVSPEVEPLAFKDACADAEAAFPKDSAPSDDQWTDYVTALDDLIANGDTEAQNALPRLRDAVDAAYPEPDDSDAFFDTRAELRNALGDLAERCKIAGSSAFQ